MPGGRRTNPAADRRSGRRCGGDADHLEGRRAFAPKPRRLRDEARDQLSAAGLTLGASVAVTIALWLLLRWWG